MGTAKSHAPRQACALFRRLGFSKHQSKVGGARASPGDQGADGSRRTTGGWSGGEAVRLAHAGTWGVGQSHARLACSTQKAQVGWLALAGASGLASKADTGCMPVLVHTMTMSPNDGLGDTHACDSAGASAANNSAALAIQFHGLSRWAHLFIVGRILINQSWGRDGRAAMPPLRAHRGLQNP